MKKIIISAHIILGIIFILFGSNFLYLGLKDYFTTDLSPKYTLETWLDFCVQNGETLPQCEERSKGLDFENIEKMEKDYAEQERRASFRSLMIPSLFLLGGFISIIAAYGFWKNRKWSSVLLSLSFIAHFFSMMFSIPLLMLGGTELAGNLLWIAILILLISITLQIVERRYIKLHWSEFK